MAKKNKKVMSNRCTLYIEGMHCKSCEVLIEKKISSIEGVSEVNVSLSEERIKIVADSKLPTIEELNDELAEYGYTFKKDKSRDENLPLFAFNNGAIMINNKKFNAASKSIGLAIIVLILFMMMEKYQVGQYVSVDSSSSLVAFFTIGFFASLSSCAALVGGIILSMTKSWHEQTILEDQKGRLVPHLSFHIGRLIGFVIFGFILGLLGSKLTLEDSIIFPLFIILISIVMLFIALQMLEVRWASKIQIGIPKSLSNWIARDRNTQSKRIAFITGALTFFLPCGFTLLVQGVALTIGDPVTSALIMGVFALGTLPALALISFTGVKMNQKPHLTSLFNKTAGIIIIFLVLYNVNSQLNLLGLPSLSDLTNRSNTSQVGVGDNGSLIDENGIQRISVTAEGFSYIPVTTMNIEAGIPTILEVDNKGIRGCGAYMAARGFIDGWIELKPGLNEISIENPKPGSYKLTCTMGMVPPVTINVN